MVLDKAMEEKAREAGREHGHAEIKHRGPLPAEPVMGIQDKSEFLSVYHQYGKDGPQLDKYIKKVCQGAFKPQHVTYNNHMTGRRNRDIFRETFYNTNN